ncbi:hypothetical protein [Halomonas sp. YLGW01]|uniref:hypothetical protein n=1 Tax=Halomonas sp. YLGW01 TaxID=2773308 RepID=UPI0017832114|nr:hypothetical protein [Halomonas sp. YLGW01]
MDFVFPYSGLDFEFLPEQPPKGIPKSIINGWAVLCTWPEDVHIGHSSFHFDDPASDRLYSAKYHHQLIRRVDDELVKRNERDKVESGGAILKIEQGDAYVSWVSREEAEHVKSMHHHGQAVEDLKSEYNQILRREEIGSLFSSYQELSGIFLPSPSPRYFSSHPRVFVVGQEPRGWRNKVCDIKNKFLIDEAGLDASMQLSQQFSASGAKTSTFLQFYRKLSSRVNPGSKDAALWSNQFCLSYKSGSSERLPPAAFDVVKRLSFNLLRAQIQILKPSVVVFTTGPGRDKYIKECFPEYETVEVIEPRRLWHFKVGNVNCIRTSHPRWVRGKEYLDRAINMVQDLA